MGEFTDKLLGGNGGKSKAIPIGSTHYEMGGVSFYLNLTPKDVLTNIVRNYVQMLQQTGQFEAANDMIKNPQPFFDQPVACAVFMAAAIDIKKQQERIEVLENTVKNLADVLIGLDAGLKPEVDAALHQLAKQETQPKGEETSP